MSKKFSSFDSNNLFTGLGALIGSSLAAPYGFEATLLAGVSGYGTGHISSELAKEYLTRFPDKHDIRSLAYLRTIGRLSKKLSDDLKLVGGWENKSNIYNYNQQNMIAASRFTGISEYNKKFLHDGEKIKSGEQTTVRWFQPCVRRIRISCSPVYVLAYLILKRIKSKAAKFGIEIDIDTTNIYGRDIFIQKNSFDLIFSPADAVVLNALNYNEKYKLELMPFYERQNVFLKRGGVFNKKQHGLNIFPNSSGHMQAHNGLNKSFLFEMKMIDQKNVWLPDILDQTEKGDSLAVWSSMNELVCAHGEYDLINETEYKVWIGLFSSREFDPELSNVFLSEFLIEKNKIIRKPIKKLMYDIILDRIYIHNYMKCIGIDI